jgi:hypothetical protein
MAELAATADGKTRLFRMGTFYWSVDDDAEGFDPCIQLKNLIEKLAADSRVTHVMPLDYDECDFTNRVFYPARADQASKH